MMKRIQVIAVLMASALTVNLAQAEAWLYSDTISSEVQVYLDTDSVRSAGHPGNLLATVAVFRPKSDVDLLLVEVNCAHNTIKINQLWSQTKPGQPGGRLVKLICSRLR